MPEKSSQNGASAPDLAPGQEGASEAAVQSHIPPMVSIPFIAFLREVGWDLKATHFPFCSDSNHQSILILR